MEEEVTRMLTQVRNGIRKIEEDRLHVLVPAPEPRYEPAATKTE